MLCEFGAFGFGGAFERRWAFHGGGGGGGHCEIVVVWLGRIREEGSGGVLGVDLR